MQAVEFTAIYPAGTADATTTYRGEKLPDFGVTGVWHAHPAHDGRGLLGMVDYLSPNPGLRLHQHAAVPVRRRYRLQRLPQRRRALPARTSTKFLPPAWRKVASERDPEKPYQNLWIASRARCRTAARACPPAT